MMGSHHLQPAELKLSPSEALDSCISAIEQFEGSVHAFVDTKLEAARITARNLDSIPVDHHGPLHGVPVAIKEIIDTAGMVCAWGSKAHAGRIAAKDAAIVTALKNAGANILGTTVSTEYAIAGAGPTRNPHDLHRTPGGSSSGSAAAVATGMASLAVGTQTIGSIIRPALYCGVPGFKLGYGTVSMDGIMPLQEHLDHVGLMAQDWRLIGSALAALGLPKCEPTAPRKCYVVSTDAPLSDAVVKARMTALAIIERAGYEIVEAPELTAKRNEMERLARDLTVAGLVSNHGADCDHQPETWTETAATLLAQGRAMSAEAIDTMHSACDTFRTQASAFAGPGDIILSDAIDDVAPVWAPNKTGDNRLQGMWSVLDLPTAAWPIDSDPQSGMPVGVQISAAMGSDRWLVEQMVILQESANARHSS